MATPTPASGQQGYRRFLTSLVRTAYVVCACEPDTDFTFVLDLILDGARQLNRPGAGTGAGSSAS